MLPAPTISFTLTSIHDDSVLDCRLYLPQDQPSNGRRPSLYPRKRAAIVAHPYAPLGGSYDDPIVELVSFSLLEKDTIVGTFNFRGAGQSSGRTSWTAKPETKDYESFIGFLAYFLHGISDQGPDFANDINNVSSSHDLSPIPSYGQLFERDPSRMARKLHSSSSHTFNAGTEESLQDLTQRTPSIDLTGDGHPLLVLAGYSYGALITTLLPPLNVILAGFANARSGSAEYEIKLRARQLSRQQNETYYLRTRTLSKHPEDLDATHNVRGRNSQLGNTTKPRIASISSMRTGGEDTDAEVRRASHESKRTIPYRTKESIRKSMDKIRWGEQDGHDTDRFGPQGPRSTGSKESIMCSHEDSWHSTSQSTNEPCLTSNKQADWSNEDDVAVMSMEVRYILISPLLGLVSNLATLWTSRPQTGRQTDSTISVTTDPVKLSKNKSLAVWGTKDLFTDKQKLRSWSAKLLSVENSKFQACEVHGAGHFWHEDGVADHMAAHVGNFAAQA